MIVTLVGFLQVRRAVRGGRIPGSKHLPKNQLTDKEGTGFLPLDQQKKVFENVGVNFESMNKQIIIYCNGGFAATVPALGLQRLGYKNWAIYDGSWNEWGNKVDGEWPVEQ